MLRGFLFLQQFLYDEYDVDRKNLNYNSTVNNRYNVAPYSNDEDRKLYFKPVYSFWIVVHPAKMRQGKIYHFNSGMEGETFEEDGQIRFSKHIESTILIENYRMFRQKLDSEIKGNTKLIKTFAVFLQRV